MKHVTRLCGLGILALLTACGGGAGPGNPNPAQEPDFVVPPRPSGSSEFVGLNQRPPEWLLSEQLAPLVAKRPVPLTTGEEAAARAEALAAARTYLGDNGFGPDDDAAVTHVLQDEYGGLHVKLCQLYKGVPVLGAGLIRHTSPDRPAMTNASLHRELLLNVTPVVTESQARAAARGAYGDEFDNRETTARLVIFPLVDLVKVRNLNAPDNTEDFEEQLRGAKLAWELVVAYLIPDLGPDALPTEDRQDADLDDARTDEERAANALRGAQDEDEGTTHDAFFEAITGAAVRYLVDAETGDLLSQQTLIDHDHFVPAAGTGHSFASGTVPLSTARHVATGKYYLMDMVRPDTSSGYGSWVLDAKNVATHTTSDMWWMTDWNNIWGDGSITNSETSPANSARRQTPAVDVAHAIQMTWDFYENVLSRWGPAGDGTRTLACVHYDDGYTDAHYNGSSKYIVFGDGANGTKAGNYGLGTVAHELGHAFWHAVGNATDTNEAKALNEGQGDIQGGLVGLYRGTGGGTGNQVRRFPNFADWRWRVRNPDGYSEEAGGITYPGLKYWSSTLKDGPEHVGGLPYGRAMIYLADGAPSDPDDTLYTTEFPDGLGGIGPTFAAHIWHFATAYFIPAAPTYANVKQAWELAATWLYGVNSMPVKAVQRAFKGIRVGAGAADVANPSFFYAQVFDVNPKDMTAAIFAYPLDDTGFRELRVSGYQNNGVYKGDIFLGYASIARASVGNNNFTFTIEDSAGKTAAVVRPFVKTRDRNLITNGDFESGMDGWTTLDGDDRVFEIPDKAFIGNGFATMNGLNALWQDVTIPASAEDVALVFRVLVRDSTKAGEMLRVQVQNTSGTPLQTLATYDTTSPPDTRNWINKGYLRQEFDLSAYAGQTIRISFLNVSEAGFNRFLLDQVVLTYVEDVSVGLPQVQVAEWDDTVSYTLPGITGLKTNEISRVDWYIDNVFVGAGPVGTTSWYGSYFLSALTPGWHWVAGRVRGHDNSILVDSQAVWFQVGLPFHELLTNGDFEAGAWDLTYSDPAPKVQVVPNGSYATVPFHGQKALKMGGQNTATKTEAGQAVQMPQQMATLTFSVRVNPVSLEDDVDNTPEDDDSLWVEFWDLTTFTKLGEFMVSHYTDQPYAQGLDHTWRGYRRKEVSIPPGLVNGKNVLVRMFTKDTATKPTTWFVDKASLRYTQFGVQMGGGG